MTRKKVNTTTQQHLPIAQYEKQHQLENMKDLLNQLNHL